MHYNILSSTEMTETVWPCGKDETRQDTIHGTARCTLSIDREVEVARRKDG